MKRGFTLLELLISISIFIAVMGMGIFAVTMQTLERGRVATDTRLTQASQNLIDLLKKEIMQANGSTVYPNLKGFYVPATFENAPKKDGMFCLSSGLYNLDPQRSAHIHAPTIDGNNGRGCTTEGSTDYLPPGFLVYSKIIDSNERLTLRTYYLDVVKKEETGNRFENHTAIFYDEYLFEQQPIEKTASYDTNSVKSSPRDLRNLPGTSLFPLSTEVKQAVQVSDDSLNVSEFRLYARPATCLKSPSEGVIKNEFDKFKTTRLLPFYNELDIFFGVPFFAPFYPHFLKANQVLHLSPGKYSYSYPYLFLYWPWNKISSTTGTEPTDSAGWLNWFKNNFHFIYANPDSSFPEGDLIDKIPKLPYLDTSGSQPLPVDNSIPKYLPSECTETSGPALRIVLKLKPTKRIIKRPNPGQPGSFIEEPEYIPNYKELEIKQDVVIPLPI